MFAGERDRSTVRRTQPLSTRFVSPPFPRLEPSSAYERRRYYALLGDALTYSAHFNTETKRMLERILTAVENSQSSDASLSVILLKTRINLAQVLLQVEGESDAQKLSVLRQVKLIMTRLLSSQRHTQWAKTFLRKNPMALTDGQLGQMFCRSNQPEHPVLTALNGSEWLTSRKSTFRTQQRQMRMCATCRGVPPRKKLFDCTQCKSVLYWYVGHDICRNGGIDQRIQLERMSDCRLART